MEVELYWQAFNDIGQIVTEPVRANEAVANVFLEPALAATANGGFTMAWAAFDSVNQTEILATRAFHLATRPVQFWIDAADEDLSADAYLVIEGVPTGVGFAAATRQGNGRWQLPLSTMSPSENTYEISLNMVASDPTTEPMDLTVRVTREFSADAIASAQFIVGSDDTAVLDGRFSFASGSTVEFIGAAGFDTVILDVPHDHVQVTPLEADRFAWANAPNSATVVFADIEWLRFPDITLPIDFFTDVSSDRFEYALDEDRTLFVDSTDGVLREDAIGEDFDTGTAVVLPPAHGTLTLGRRGDLTYVPAADFAGTDSFRFDTRNISFRDGLPPTHNGGTFHGRLDVGFPRLDFADMRIEPTVGQTYRISLTLDSLFTQNAELELGLIDGAALTPNGQTSSNLPSTEDLALTFEFVRGPNDRGIEFRPIAIGQNAEIELSFSAVQITHVETGNVVANSAVLDGRDRIVTLVVNGIADPPIVEAVSPLGQVDERLAIPITVGLQDLDGSEHLRIFVTDLPPNATISDGQRSFPAAGEAETTVENSTENFIEVTDWDLSRLTLVSTQPGDFVFSIEAISAEDTGDEATTILPVVAYVEPAQSEPNVDTTSLAIVPDADLLPKLDQGPLRMPSSTLVELGELVELGGPGDTPVIPSVTMTTSQVRVHASFSQGARPTERHPEHDRERHSKQALERNDLSADSEEKPAAATAKAPPVAVLPTPPVLTQTNSQQAPEQNAHEPAESQTAGQADAVPPVRTQASYSQRTHGLALHRQSPPQSSPRETVSSERNSKQPIVEFVFADSATTAEFLPTGLWEHVDDIVDDLQESSPTTQVIAGTAVIVATGFSALQVTWLIRGSIVLANASAAPSWLFVDPLPVLNSFRQTPSKNRCRESLAEIAKSS